MSGKLNDQKPKPMLGNSSLKGYKHVDWSGGANPTPRRFKEVNKKGKEK